MKKFIKCFLKAIGLILLLLVTIIVAAQRVRFSQYKKLEASSINEDGYVMLGGQQQYIGVRGTNPENPVIIFLHGGPGAGGTFMNHIFSDPLVSDYTIVGWDQRGCGRTYLKNKSADPKNSTATFEQLQRDLDELVDYARERFGQDRVIIMGHSWGTVAGSVYVQEHPEKVDAYIGVGQVIDSSMNDIWSYDDARAKAAARGKSVSAMDKAAQKYKEKQTVDNLRALRTITLKYHPYDTVPNLIGFGWNYVTSPYWSLEDVRYLLTDTSDTEQHLMDYAMEFDIHTRSLSYEVPMYFISGTDDWICPVEPIRDFADSITAPASKLVLMEGTGHLCLYTEPEEFAEAVRGLSESLQ